MHNTDKPYYEYLGLNPDDFQSIVISGLGFSARLFKRLELKQIVTVADLLRTSEELLKNVKGFGSGCFEELNKYFDTLCVRIDVSERQMFLW